MRLRTSACLAVAGAALLPATAGAAVVDRVQVGVPGTVTRAFAENLSLALESPSAYDRACCTDFVTGTWQGPDVQASGSSEPQNPSRIEWSVTYARGSRSAASLARSAGWAQYPEVSGRKVRVPHVIGGRTVGRLRAFAALDAEPAPGAQVQGALAIPLGKRVTAIALFHASDPAADSSSAGTLTVRGTSASRWNRGQTGEALSGVTVEGALPPRKIKARRSGGRVRGSVADSFGHPVGGVRVELQRRAGGGWRRAARGTTSSSGKYSLGGARGGGRYRVVVKLGGTTARRTVR